MSTKGFNYDYEAKARWDTVLGPLAVLRGRNGWEVYHCAYCGGHEVLTNPGYVAYATYFHGTGMCVEQVSRG